jgi:hypothetical protein
MGGRPSNASGSESAADSRFVPPGGARVLAVRIRDLHRRRRTHRFPRARRDGRGYLVGFQLCYALKTKIDYRQNWHITKETNFGRAIRDPLRKYE